MAKRWDVFGVGSAAVDDLLYVERFPMPDEKIPVQNRCRQGGGQTATALVAAARQGARAGFCGCLGDDELSRYTIEELEREGVDCSPVISVPGAKPFHAVVIVDSSSGSRTILYSGEGVQDPPNARIDPDWIRDSQVLFIEHNNPQAGLHAALLAHQYHVPVVADIEKIHTPGLDRLLAEVDHLIVSFSFARQRTGQEDIVEMVRELGKTGRAASVVTWGERGCWYCEGRGPVLHFPAYPVTPVDTTGCGDVFHGCYAAAIARGETVAQAIAVASASAAIKTTQPGGRAGIPSLARAKALVMNKPYEDLPR